MAEIYTSGTAFTTATTIEAWIEYPFNEQGDTTTKVYKHIMQVNRGSYAPLAYDDVMTAAGEKPTRSPFSDDSSAYWVGDSEPRDVGGGIVEFERTFANVPADRTEAYGLYPFTFPGITQQLSTATLTSTGNYAESITSSLGETLSFDIQFDLSSADAATLAVGDPLRITNSGDTFDVDPDDGLSILSTYTFNEGFYQVRVKSIVNTTIVVNVVVPNRTTGTTPTIDGNPNGTRTSYAVLRSSYGDRDPFTKSSSSILTVTYEKVSDPSTISSLATSQVVVTSGGAITDTATNSTIPTALEYTRFITQGTYINAEDESFERWKGNIYERRIIKVLAR